jgi:hypothetical protein
MCQQRVIAMMNNGNIPNDVSKQKHIAGHLGKMWPQISLNREFVAENRAH